MADNGLTTIQSRYDARVTADRLEAAAKAKGLTVSRGTIMGPARRPPACRCERPYF